MDYEAELRTVQTWLKSTAGLKSFKRGVKLNLPRPVVCFDSPGRSRARHLTRYAYVQTVTWPCTLYVNSLDESVKYQELLLTDLEDKCSVLEIMDGDKHVSWLKDIKLKFTDTDSLDVRFTLTYDVAYKRSGYESLDEVIVPEVIHNNLQVYQNER